MAHLSLGSLRSQRSVPSDEVVIFSEEPGSATLTSLLPAGAQSGPTCPGALRVAPHPLFEGTGEPSPCLQPLQGGFSTSTLGQALGPADAQPPEPPAVLPGLDGHLRALFVSSEEVRFPAPPLSAMNSRD